MEQLRLPEWLFWYLTPLLFSKLCEQYEQIERRADHRAGLVAAMLLNVNRSKSTDKVWGPQDFFAERSAAPVEQTDEEMVVVMDMWVARTSHLEH